MAEETPAQAPITNGKPSEHETSDTAVINSTISNSDSPDINGEEPAPIVRMRSPDTNGVQATMNGHAALQRGLEALAETEVSQSIEEIKKLDTQLDHFNQYLDKFEKKNSEMTDRVTNLLKSQKEERVKRRASFLQREEELKAEQDSFESQLRSMFAKCAQMRRSTAPALDNGVNGTGEHGRIIRERANDVPIQEINGHDESNAA